MSKFLLVNTTLKVDKENLEKICKNKKIKSAITSDNLLLSIEQSLNNFYILSFNCQEDDFKFLKDIIFHIHPEEIVYIKKFMDVIIKEINYFLFKLFRYVWRTY